MQPRGLVICELSLVQGGSAHTLSVLWQVVLDTPLRLSSTWLPFRGSVVAGFTVKTSSEVEESVHWHCSLGKRGSVGINLPRLQNLPRLENLPRSFSVPESLPVFSFRG